MASTQTNVIFRDVQYAREIQERIFPSAHPFIPNLDYYGDWRRSGTLGGDYLDYFELEDGSLCLAVGDVTGQGLDAALLTASLHGIVRALRISPIANLAHFVGTIDDLFRGVCPNHCHASLFVGRYDPVSRRFDYVNAGHEPPFVIRQNRVIRLESGGPVIGMLRRPPFRERSISLHAGDVLVAHTDGFYDAANARGEEWGWRRLVESIQELRRRRARDIVQGVFESIDDFSGGSPPPSDLTLWIGRIAEASSKLRLDFAECEDLVAA